MYNKILRDILSKCQGVESIKEKELSTFRVYTRQKPPDYIDVTAMGSALVPWVESSYYSIISNIVMKGFVVYKKSDLDGRFTSLYRRLKGMQCMVEWVSGKPGFTVSSEIKYLESLTGKRIASKTLIDALADDKKLLELINALGKDWRIEVILYDGIDPVSEPVEIGEIWSIYEVKRKALLYYQDPKELEWMIYMRRPIWNTVLIRKVHREIDTAIKVMNRISEATLEITNDLTRKTHAN